MRFETPRHPVVPLSQDQIKTRRQELCTTHEDVSPVAFRAACGVAFLRHRRLEVRARQFEASGITNDPDIRAAKSIVDYTFCWIGKKFLTTDQQEEIGILSPEVRARPAGSYNALEGKPADPTVTVEAAPPGQTALFNAFEDSQ